MKYSLSKRLFFITLSLLLCLISFTLIFQVFFFEPFYEKKKQSNLIDEVNKYKNMYAYQFYDQNIVINSLSALENRINARIAIYSVDGEQLYFPNKYNRENNEDGKALNAFFSNIYNNEEIFDEVMSSGKTRSQVFYNNSTNTKIIGVISAISINTTNDAVIIATSSIQPIQEASSVITELYIYFFIGFIFVSILLSSIFTNLITKPLVKIDKVAKRMSKMDFTERCEITHDDEIGNLAKTLNFLSSTLEETLSDLQNKNKKLEIDIKNERKLELMRKDFVNSVSHELKTPIGIIEGYAEGIKDGIVSDQDILVYLETIIDEAKKMGVLVSNMLELSKIESGIQEPKLEIFNINRLINKIVKKHTIDAEENSLSITFTPYTDYSYVLADRFQMEQVLTNLVTNAIKYTPKGGEVILSISEEKNLFYKITVINTNTYLNEEDIPKLFNKFYRSDKSGDRGNSSTGLGLSIVKNLLDLHNSPFSLINIREGVAFSFWLQKETLTEEDY